MDAGMAGNFVQATIFMGICVGWVSTYLWRVANKVGQVRFIFALALDAVRRPVRCSQRGCPQSGHHIQGVCGSAAYIEI
jgi:hypothetical protein